MNFVEIKNSTLARAPRPMTSPTSVTVTSAAAPTSGPATTSGHHGFNKHRTVIGLGAFIGSNSSLVAPVKIGDGAYIGSGGRITKDVAGGRTRARALGPGGAARLGGEVPRHDGRLVESGMKGSPKTGCATRRHL